MTKPQPLTAPSVRHLLGRRSEGRVAMELAVECQGALGRHQGKLVDLSRHGALFTLFDERFQAPRDADLVAVAERLSAEFGTRLTVRFARRSVVLNATLVRAVREPSKGRTLVACTFDRTLTVRERRLLRLDVSEKNQLP